MASIERTAYPRFKRTPTAKELSEVYTPTPQEIQFAYATARGAEPILSLLAMLKAFQRLGYFPAPGEIPGSVVDHIRACLGISAEVTPQFPERSRYRHQKAIREYLEVLPYGKHPRHVATEVVFKAAQVMDNPADLINVAIEELIKQRCELPAFSTLDRLPAVSVRWSTTDSSPWCWTGCLQTTAGDLTASSTLMMRLAGVSSTS